MESVDAVTIGGECVGANTLYHLAELGCTDTVLLEKEALAAGAYRHSSPARRTCRRQAPQRDGAAGSWRHPGRPRRTGGLPGIGRCCVHDREHSGPLTAVCSSSSGPRRSRYFHSTATRPLTR